MRRNHKIQASKMTYNGNLAKNSIIEKSDLPRHIQRKMTGRTVKANSALVTFSNPTFYQPLFQATNMLLPRDRRERNEWCRHFYRTEPIVATALDLHTELPISDFSHICSDQYIKRFYDYMAFEKLDVLGLLLDVGLEYWKIGDAFPMGQFNESTGMWESFTLLNPDFVNVTGSIFAGEQQIELIPDDQLTNIVSGGPAGVFGELYRQLPEDVIMAVKQGKNIQLDNRLVTHIAHKASHYETWGTPILMRCFKTLIYKDKLRQAQDAIANRHIFPLRVAKLGTPGEPYPTQEDIESFRDMLDQMDGDPTSFIVYHYGLSFDYVGSSGHLLQLSPELDFIQNELLTGLCITSEVLNGNTSNYNANSGNGTDYLAKRYMTYRMRLESWLRHKVYKPVAEVQGFYRPKNGTIARRLMSGKEMKRAVANKEMELIVPGILWQQNDTAWNTTIMNVIEKLHEKQLVSTHTLLELCKLSPEAESRMLMRERGTQLDVNSPGTGPLPMPNPYENGGFETGTTIRENVKKEDDEGEQITTNNSPEDFGMPKKHVENSEVNVEKFFTRRGRGRSTGAQIKKQAE